MFKLQKCCCLEEQKRMGGGCSAACWGPSAHIPQAQTGARKVGLRGTGALEASAEWLRWRAALGRTGGRRSSRPAGEDERVRAKVAAEAGTAAAAVAVVVVDGGVPGDARAGVCERRERDATKRLRPLPTASAGRLLERERKAAADIMGSGECELPRRGDMGLARAGGDECAAAAAAECWSRIERRRGIQRAAASRGTAWALLDAAWTDAAAAPLPLPVVAAAVVVIIAAVAGAAPHPPPAGRRSGLLALKWSVSKLPVSSSLERRGPGSSTSSSSVELVRTKCSMLSPSSPP